ncbi:transcription elongation factor S-II protein [Trichuris suis]|nr:transcription elongation factor S-II protein [Trichuris suis]
MDVKKKVELLQQCLLSENVDKETGVGKTVNKFRSDPVIGSAAKALVHKWKQIAISTAVSNGIKVDCTKPSSKSVSSDVEKKKSLVKLVEQCNAIERKRRESSLEQPVANKISRVNPQPEQVPCSSKAVSSGQNSDFSADSGAETDGGTKEENWEFGGGSFEDALCMIDKKVTDSLTKARISKKRDNIKSPQKPTVKKSEILKSLSTLVEQSEPSLTVKEGASHSGNSSASALRGSPNDKTAAVDVPRCAVSNFANLTMVKRRHRKRRKGEESAPKFCVTIGVVFHIGKEKESNDLTKQERRFRSSELSLPILKLISIWGVNG